ncbi:MAG: DEAD/DEAH box helicase [Desulfurococcaceae archaeon]|nr:DEAD/DEAH box helicase [Desulfurococcaceae archaeon]
MIKLKTREWLEEEDFKELLKVTDYIGFENGYKVFILNIKKALQNNYTLSDVKNLIEELGLEVEGSWREVENAFKDYSITVRWDSTRGLVRIEYPVLIDKLVKSVIDTFTSTIKYRRRVNSTTNTVLIEIIPYYAYSLIAKLRDLGLVIKDLNGLFTPKPLVIKPELKNISLRNYQEEALQAWIKNNYRGIIALPTGSGKSIIALAAITNIAVRTLIVVYTKEQSFQWREFLLKYTNIPSNMVGLFYSEEKKLSPITIITYQSGFRYINQISPYFEMIIVDEVHHLPAEKFKYIALHSLARFRMGLSATPEREDGKHEELFPLMGGVVYYKSPSELVEQGYLAPYQLITIRVKLDKEELLKYKQLRQLYLQYSKGKNFKEVLEEARKGVLDSIEALKIHSELRKLIALSNSKINKAVEIAIKEYESGNKVIVFTQYIDQAREIAERTKGLLLIGEMPENERKRVLEVFKQAPRGILVVTTIGDEGIDIPDANVGIIVSGTGSKRQFIQRLGRLLRPKTKGTCAKLYEIIAEKTSEEYQLRKRRSVIDAFIDLENDT